MNKKVNPMNNSMFGGNPFEADDHGPLDDDLGETHVPTSTLGGKNLLDEIGMPELEKLYFDMIWMIDFEDLPPVFKDYVTARASRIASNRMVNNPQSAKLLEQDEAAARAIAIEYDTKQADHNIFSDFNYHQDANTTYRPFKVLRRM